MPHECSRVALPMPRRPDSQRKDFACERPPGDDRFMLATARQMAGFTVLRHSGQAPRHRPESTLVPLSARTEKVAFRVAVRLRTPRKRSFSGTRFLLTAA